MQTGVPVWDPLQRLLHWLLALLVVASWYTRHGFGAVHEWLGYAAAATLALRLAWGFIGPRHARFSDFVYSPAHTRAYLRDSLAGTARRHLGHNPLGGWMSLALWLAVLLVCASGWLYTTDRFWGLEWVEDLHDALTWLLIALVCLHLGGVAWSSWRHRENLVASMLHGRKRAPAGRDLP